MKIATWNVNSVRKRTGNLLAWLEQAKPDVVVLQEIKAQEAQFPRLEVEAAGYKVEIVGQKGFNGVAMLSQHPVEITARALPDAVADEPARYIEGRITTPKGPLTVGGLYLPNGNPIGTEKFAYKIAWMDRLNQRARELLAKEEMFVLGGDYNVCPTEMDVYDPEGLRQRRALPAAVARGAAQPAQSRPDRRGARLPARHARLHVLGLPGRLPGPRTGACASTTCCSRRRPPTG